jgi:hypothetical protein
LSYCTSLPFFMMLSLSCGFSVESFGLLSIVM